MISDTCPFCKTQLLLEESSESYLMECPCGPCAANYKLYFDKKSNKLLSENFYINYTEINIEFISKFIYIHTYDENWEEERLEALRRYPSRGYLKLLESRSLI